VTVLVWLSQASYGLLDTLRMIVCMVNGLGSHTTEGVLLDQCFKACCCPCCRHAMADSFVCLVRISL
jgi:hypothetical protein